MMAKSTPNVEQDALARYKKTFNEVLHRHTPPHAPDESSNAHAQLIQLAHEAELCARTNKGYETVLLDAETFHTAGHPEKAALLTFAAEQGNRHRHIPTYPNVVERPENTFDKRLRQFYEMSEDLESAKIYYENCRIMSNQMAYPLGMCITCRHHHVSSDTPPQRKNSSQQNMCEECECRTNQPADANMNRTYQAYYALSAAKKNFEHYENELLRPHLGDRWIVAFGDHVGKRGCSMKSMRENNTHYVSILTDEGENFWVEVKHVTRDLEGLPPGLFDPEN